MGCNCCPSKIASTAVTVVCQKVQVVIPSTVLLEQNKYCLILAQPVPVAGYNLPVVINNGGTLIPLHKYGFGNIEFGEDLPKCRNRIPLYYSNALELVDLRGCEHHCYCGR